MLLEAMQQNAFILQKFFLSILMMALVLQLNKLKFYNMKHKLETWNKQQQIQMLDKWHFQGFSYSKQTEYIAEEAQFERTIISQLFQLMNRQQNYEQYLLTVGYGQHYSFQRDRDGLKKKDEEDQERHGAKMRGIGVRVMEIQQRKLRIRQRINQIHEQNERLSSQNQSMTNDLGFVEETTQQIQQLLKQNEYLYKSILNNQHQIADQLFHIKSKQSEIDMLSQRIIKCNKNQRFQIQQQNIQQQVQQLNATKARLIDCLSIINTQRQSQFQSHLKDLFEVNSKIFQLDSQLESLERDVEWQYQTLKELKQKFKKYDFRHLDLWKGFEAKTQVDSSSVENSKGYFKHLLNKTKKYKKIKTQGSSLVNQTGQPYDCYECLDFRPASMLEFDSLNIRKRIEPSQKSSESQILDKKKNQSSLPSIWSNKKSEGSYYKNGRASSIQSRNVLSCLKLK